MSDDAATTTEVKPEIKELGDKIVGLTLLDAQSLSDYLKDEYGIEPASGGAVMMAGPAGGDGGGAAEEQTEFNVMLTGVGDKKIQVIKAVRAITGLGLKEAKELVEGAPKPIKEGIEKDEAQKIKEQIEGAGGQADIK